MDDNQADEETRLLGPHPSDLTVSQTPVANSKTGRPSALRTILSTAAALLILNMGSHITLAPQTAILQDIVCAKYYASSTPPWLPSRRGDSGECKIEPVQSEVAHINAWKDVFEALPGMFLAVPYGTLADRIGRKKIFLLAIVGCFLNDVWIRVIYWFSDSFPVRAVWFGGLWQLIGGGAATFSSVSFVLVADICPAEQRTNAFAQVQAATLLSRFVFVPVGGVLISTSPWIPMAIGQAFMATGFLVALFFVPETLSPLSSTQAPSGEAGAVIKARAHGARKAIHGHVRERLKASMLPCRWMAKNAELVLCLLCFLLFHLGEQADALLILQYAAKRLGWTVGEAAFISSLGSGVNLVVLTFLIPALSSFLMRRPGVRETVKDKRIAQLSGLFLVIGSAMVARARSWMSLVLGQVVYSCGYAFTVPTRSLVTGMVEQRHLGTLYTVISVLSYTGVIAGEPLFAAAFRWGMSFGDSEAWVGIPFLIAAACFMLVLVIISVITAPVDAAEARATAIEDEISPESPGSLLRNDGVIP